MGRHVIGRYSEILNSPDKYEMGKHYIPQNWIYVYMKMKHIQIKVYGDIPHDIVKWETTTGKRITSSPGGQNK